MRYWREMGNACSQEGTDVITTTSDTTSTRRNGTDSACRFPKGNTSIHMRDELGTFFRDEDFLDLFSQKGQPAESAWRLALVMVMQYAEGLTDRQAADAVRTRIDWKYALSLDITDPGFDFSVLSEFRGRLLTNQAERRLFDVMLSQCARTRVGQRARPTTN
jgi:transposase